MWASLEREIVEKVYQKDIIRINENSRAYKILEAQAEEVLLILEVRKHIGERNKTKFKALKEKCCLERKNDWVALITSLYLKLKD